MRKEYIAKGTLNQLNERYGLPTNTPIESLCDAIMNRYKYAFNLTVSCDHGIYTIKVADEATQ